jgi:hypothetical protein
MLLHLPLIAVVAVAGVAVVARVVTVEAAATTSTTLLARGNLGAATNACPGLVPWALVFSVLALIQNTSIATGGPTLAMGILCPISTVAPP